MRRILTEIILAAAIAGAFVSGAAGAEKKFYSDDPLWKSPPPVPVKQVAKRPVNDYYDFFSNTLAKPGQHAAKKGVSLPSQATNTVDEVPDSAWYTNRHAMRRMSIEELKRGPGDTDAPANGPWTVTAAKNEGVTPGFRIRDTAGRQYLLKFDPLSNPEMASAADVISSKFFYALGYNVPENYVVNFEANRLVIGENAQLKDDTGRTRPMINDDIEAMLAKAPMSGDHRYRGMASRIISGKPVGPFLYFGTRGDDPNDVVLHEHRRDLRGLRTMCAWLGHDDSKSINSLDLVVTEKGVQFVKHYLIDFGATLGSASFMANSPRDGNVYLFDWSSSAAQFLSLGLYVPKWQRARYPHLPAVGRFEYEVFNPDTWKSDYPNPAFRNENPADRLWAARKIAAFTDDEIRAIVSTGQYTDTASTDWVARCLIERRNKILRAYLNGMGALEGFSVAGNRLEIHAVGSNTPPQPKVRWSVFDNGSGEKRAISGEGSLEIPTASGSAEFLTAELTDGSPQSIEVYVRLKKEGAIVVGVERKFAGGSHKE